MKAAFVLFLFWLGCVNVRSSNASVELSWTPPTNLATVIDGYYICYGTNRGHYYGSNEVCDWATSNCLISGFGVFGGPYYFSAVSFATTTNGIYVSPYSNETNWTPANPSSALLTRWLIYTNVPYVTPLIVSNSARHVMVTNYWYVAPYACVVALTNNTFTNYVFSVQETPIRTGRWIDIYTNSVPLIYTDKVGVINRLYRLRYIP